MDAASAKAGMPDQEDKREGPESEDRRALGIELPGIGRKRRRRRRSNGRRMGEERRGEGGRIEIQQL